MRNIVPREAKLTSRATVVDADTLIDLVEAVGVAELADAKGALACA